MGLFMLARTADEALRRTGSSDVTAGSDTIPDLRNRPAFPVEDSHEAGSPVTRLSSRSPGTLPAPPIPGSTG